MFYYSLQALYIRIGKHYLDWVRRLVLCIGTERAWYARANWQHICASRGNSCLCAMPLVVFYFSEKLQSDPSVRGAVRHFLSRSLNCVDVRAVYHVVIRSTNTHGCSIWRDGRLRCSDVVQSAQYTIGCTLGVFDIDVSEQTHLLCYCRVWSNIKAVART